MLNGRRISTKEHTVRPVPLGGRVVHGAATVVIIAITTKHTNTHITIML